MTQPVPKHGAQGTCKHCGRPLLFWNVNPNNIGAHWFHPGPMYDIDGLGNKYCNITEGEPRHVS